MEDSKFDVIILRTGLTESIVAACVFSFDLYRLLADLIQCTLQVGVQSSSY